MRIRRLLFALMLGTLASLGRADDTSELAVKRDVEKAERLRPQDRLYLPEFISKPDDRGGEFVLMTSAIGGDGDHSRRLSWLYHVTNGRAKRLFKLPFDATELIVDSSATAKGFFWVYDCYLCDGPEAGYIFKIPVVTKTYHHQSLLVVDVAKEDRRRLKTESLSVLDKALAKYGKTRKEPNQLKREVITLFGNGLSSERSP